MVQTRRLTPGTPEDGKSLHLVELADKRLLVAQFSDTGNLQMNVRSYAQAADYLTGTGGHTWSSAVSNVWNTMSSVLGSFPGLPAQASPDGVPENLRLIGMNAWRALDVLLRQLDCTVSYNPIADTFGIVFFECHTARSADNDRWR